MMEINVTELIMLTGFAVSAGIFLSMLVDDYEKRKPVHLKNVLIFTLCVVVVFMTIVFIII